MGNIVPRGVIEEPKEDEEVQESEVEMANEEPRAVIEEPREDEEVQGLFEYATTDRIKVSKLPDDATEDGLTLFFENRKRSRGGAVVAVDYDRKNKTAIVIFEDEDVVERVMNHNPLLFNEKLLEVERIYIENEVEEKEYNSCSIEVTGMNQSTTKYNLILYFESTKGADDDVQNILYVEEEEMYLVKFSNEDIVDAVLKKKHTLEGSELQIKKHIPPQAEDTYPKHVSVCGFNMNTTEQSLRNFLEARSKKDVEKIIFGDIEETAIVVFKSQPDIDQLKTECKKRQLDGKYLKVAPVPVSKCIIVTGLKAGTSKDAVFFYFDNKKKSGVEGVEEVEMDKQNNSAVVFFIDTQSPVDVCKRTHKIEGWTVQVEIYHDCLGGTMNGDGPNVKCPDPIDVDLDVRKAQCVVDIDIRKAQCV